MSSAGIRVLLKAYKEMESFSIIHANENVQEIIEMVGLGAMLHHEKPDNK